MKPSKQMELLGHDFFSIYKDVEDNTNERHLLSEDGDVGTLWKSKQSTS